MAEAEPRRDAHAPYNFIPLPETVVAAQTPLPSHDRYDTSRFTGRFEVTLTTETPLFVRGMLTPDEVEILIEHEKSVSMSNRQTSENKKRHPLETKPDFFQLSECRPIIPGSSLRGMLRSLIEMITFSKIQPVSDKQLLYRAVGDTTSYGRSYREQMLGTDKGAGRLSQFDYPAPQLRAGYLRKTNFGYSIQPAKQIDNEYFVFVSIQDIQGQHIRLQNQTTQKVWVRPVKSRTHHKTSNLNKDVYIDLPISTGIKLAPGPGYEAATLVVSGQMNNRKWHQAIFEPDPHANLIEIDKVIWDIYAEDRDLKRGINARRLQSGSALFYLVDSDEKLVFFGPSMMFRLPHSKRITSFIPVSQLSLDIAENLFGWVSRDAAKTGRKPVAGRVFVTDAVVSNDQSDFFMEEIAPKILGTPKPTTFQHYIRQPFGKHTEKRDLNHFGSENVQIRGHKLYWRQNNIRLEDIAESDQQTTLRNIINGTDTQHTRICPVKPGIAFTFQVHFENLSAEELGALAWALMLPGNERHRHQMGMGKPYGMGVIHCHPVTLLLSNRLERYLTLLEPQQWYEAENQASVEPFIEAFEAYISDALPQSGTFRDQPRIREVFTMLELHEPRGDTFKYMTIEPNQYKERLVLPYPSEVFKSANPSDSKLGTAHPQAQQAEYKPPKSSRQQLATRGPQVGDNIRGKVLDNEGDLLFTPEEYPQCEAVIPKEKINKKRKVDEVVKAIIVEVHFESEPILLICEQIIPEQHKP